MSPEPLRHVLQATGYLLDGEPAPGVQLGETAQRSRRRSRDFVPDALWRSPSALTVYFKSESTTPSKELVGAWRREIWNEGFAPLLWVISPERIDVYNGFGTPVNDGDAREHLLRTFGLVESALRELDEFAGRIALETGQFWLQDNVVDRKTGVDQKLLSDLAHLEHDLVERWSPSFRQLGGPIKVKSGFIGQAASGCDEAGQSPGLRAPPTVYASAGVRSPSDECGRRSL